MRKPILMVCGVSLIAAFAVLAPGISNAAPPSVPPGQGGTAPGLGGTPPGQGGTPPGPGTGIGVGGAGGGVPGVACGTPAAASNPHCTPGGGGNNGGGKKKVHRGNSNTGKIVVGCIIGSAAGAITASIRKATALGNPPRWRSQAEHEKIVASGYEKQFELTNAEAHTAVALCGLGSFALHWQKAAPVKAHVVKARY